MSEYISGLAPDIIAMLDYREALGYSRKSQEACLKSLDRFCAANCPEADTLTKEIVFDWLDEQHSGLAQKATAVRSLGTYMRAVGKDAYVLYHGFMKEPSRQPAYVFTDGELSALFRAIDKIKATIAEPFLPEIAPVMYRLIYTCGLRPNEGRELKRANIELKTGEILITNTKWKKGRLVVMSGDMLSMCRAYDKHRDIFARGSEYFFPSWESGGPFGTSQVGYYFRGAWEQANPKVDSTVLPKIRVYDLRHRFASAVLIRWLNSGQPLGAKLPYLRAYMGHSSLYETAYYIHLLPENLVKSAGIDWAAFDEMVPEVILWEA
jgi:integrase